MYPSIVITVIKIVDLGGCRSQMADAATNYKGEGLQCAHNLMILSK